MAAASRSPRVSVAQERVDRDEVRLGEEALEAARLRPVLGEHRGTHVGIAGQDPEPEAARLVRDAPPDPPEPDDPEGPAAQSMERPGLPVIPLAPARRRREDAEPARAGEHERHRVIRDLVDAVVGDVDDRDATGSGGADVDLVVAGAVGADDPAVAERRDDRRVGHEVLAEERVGVAHGGAARLGIERGAVHDLDAARLEDRALGREVVEDVGRHDDTRAPRSRNHGAPPRARSRAATASANRRTRSASASYWGSMCWPSTQYSPFGFAPGRAAITRRAQATSSTVGP